jgi:glyoxylase-like metal-dependent hydrolase (beta-lactamase superfamily II)
MLMKLTYEVIPIRVCFSHIINYTYLIIDLESRKAALVDPAWDKEKIVLTMRAHNAVLTSIFLTHSHFDHVNLVEPLVEQFGVNVYMSKIESDFYHFTCTNLSTISESDVIRIGNTMVSCLFTPGHTAGSSCYMLSNCLFTGDTMFTEGCGLCRSAGSSPIQMFRTLRRLKTQIASNMLIYPGHSFGEIPGQPFAELLQKNIYLQFTNEQKFIKFRMRENQPDSYSFT